MPDRDRRDEKQVETADYPGPVGAVFLLGVFAWVFLRISLLTAPGITFNEKSLIRNGIIIDIRPLDMLSFSYIRFSG